VHKTQISQHATEQGSSTFFQARAALANTYGPRAYNIYSL